MIQYDNCYMPQCKRIPEQLKITLDIKNTKWLDPLYIIKRSVKIKIILCFTEAIRPLPVAKYYIYWIQNDYSNWIASELSFKSYNLLPWLCKNVCKCSTFQYNFNDLMNSNYRGNMSQTILWIMLANT